MFVAWWSYDVCGNLSDGHSGFSQCLSAGAGMLTVKHRRAPQYLQNTHCWPAGIVFRDSRNTALFLIGIGPLVSDFLKLQEQLGQDDLQLRGRIRMICTAPKKTHIHNISEDIADAERILILSGVILNPYLF